MGSDRRQRDRPSIEFKVDGNEIGYYCNKFEWVCFVNSGHRITASFKDTHEHVLKRETINSLLEKAKSKDGLNISVRIYQDFHRGAQFKKTEVRKFKVLSLNSNMLGSLTESVLEIVAIDIASWELNRGKCEGKAYKGNVSSVIKQIVNEYTSVSATVDKTKDSENNYWWDMRLDPKTLITSLIEWSSAITKNGTPLIVQNQDDEFRCKEWASLTPTKTNNKKFYINDKYGGNREWQNDGELQILSNNFLSPIATKLYTGSISATTGLYIDKQNPQITPKQKWANDEFTGNKLKPQVSSSESYTKSSDDFGTFIEPVPEHNNGDVGLTYQDYSVGRALDWFTKIIYTTLRVKITIDPGDTDFDSIFACGRDRIELEVRSIKDNKPYYINGKWLLYGFRHQIDWSHWQTELHLSRIEHDATGKPI